MSDFSRDKYNFGFLDPALDQLQRGQDAVAGGMQQRGRDMRADRQTGMQALQGMISEGDAAAANLDPNDPEDAAALQAWAEEKAAIMDRITGMTGPDVLNASLGFGTGALTGIRQRSTAAQQAREDEVAERDFGFESRLITIRGGVEMDLQSAANEFERLMLNDELAFRGAEGNRQRMFEWAMQEAAQRWQGNEMEKDRVLRETLAEAGFEIDRENINLAQLRLILDREIAMADDKIDRARVNLAGEQINLDRAQMIYDSFLPVATSIKEAEEGPEKDARIEAFIEEISLESSNLTDWQISALARTAELPVSATTEEIRARTGLTTARTERESIQSAMDIGGYIGEQATLASDAAQNGRPSEVRAAIYVARAVAEDPARYGEDAAKAAQAIVDDQEELLALAEEREREIGRAQDLGLEDLENQVAMNEITMVEARDEWVDRLVSRYDTWEEIESFIDDQLTVGRQREWFGSTEEAAADIRARFRMKKLIEERGEDAIAGEALMASPPDSPEEGENWVESVVDFFSRDTMWGPGEEDVIRAIAEQKLAAHQRGLTGDLADLANLNARTAAALAQGRMYDAQAQPEGEDLLGLLEFLGDFHSATMDQLGQVNDYVSTVCDAQSASYDSGECEKAKTQFGIGMQTSQGLINTILIRAGLGPDGSSMPFMSAEDAVAEWEAQRANGASAEEVINQNEYVFGAYQDEFYEVFPEAHPDYEPPEGESSGRSFDASSLTDLAASLWRGGENVVRQATQSTGNAILGAVNWGAGMDMPFIDLTPWNNDEGGGGGGATTPERPTGRQGGDGTGADPFDVSGAQSRLVTEDNASTDALFNSLISSESGGIHQKPEGLTESVDGALGATQIMPDTMLDPGWGIEPLVTLTEQERSRDQTLRAAIDSARTDEERDRYTEQYRALWQEIGSRPSEEDYLRFGRQYLDAMLGKYNGDVALALAAYNAGPGRIDSAIRLAAEAGDPSQWRNYIDEAGGDSGETLPYVEGILARIQSGASGS